jgi:hypothetical protein
MWECPPGRRALKMRRECVSRHPITFNTLRKASSENGPEKHIIADALTDN